MSADIFEVGNFVEWDTPAGASHIGHNGKPGWKRHCGIVIEVVEANHKPVSYSSLAVPYRTYVVQEGRENFRPSPKRLKRAEPVEVDV